MAHLVPMMPVRHSCLGIESLTSYLRRLADLYSISLYQLLRYLCESREVSDLVEETPFRAPTWRPYVLSGYSKTVARLTRRVAAATGNYDAPAMTLQKIGPSLTVLATGAIAAQRRYCNECVHNLMRDESQPRWEPLIWSLATISCCPIHGEPLFATTEEWEAVDVLHGSKVDVMRDGKTRNWCEDWRLAETFKLISYCSHEPTSFTVGDALSIFLISFMKLRQLSIPQLSKVLPFDSGNIRRVIESGQKMGLDKLFALAQRVAISPADILDDPGGSARQDALLGISEHIDEITETAVFRRRRRSHALAYDLLLSDMRNLMVNRHPLPSLRSICHARGVSTGFARYRMPDLTERYQARRSKERLDEYARKIERARQVARKAVQVPGRKINLKRLEQELRAETGLPKHLLAHVLKEAFW